MGRSLLALFAGYRPKITPTPIEKPIASSTTPALSRLNAAGASSPLAGAYTM